MQEFDSALVMRQIGKGDEEAFRRLYEEFGGYVFKIVVLSIRNKDKAEELTQEIFLKLWRFASKYDPSRPFKPWLSRVVGNEIISFHRTQKEETESIDDLKDDIGFQPSDSDDVRENDHQKDVSRELECNLNLLTDNQREVIVLKFYQGLKIREIADALQIGESAVKARLYTALETLSKKIQGAT